MGLTPKQQQILEYIQRFSSEHGYAPSQTELAREFGFSSLGTVQNYLVRLEREGFLKKSWNARRGLQVVRTRASTPPRATRQAPGAASPSSASVSASGAGTVPLPILGRVAAGRPIEALATPAAGELPETIDVPSHWIDTSRKRGSGGLERLRVPEHFALRVVGDSMIGDGILDGDVVVIRKQPTANNGETVVALIGGTEATIKRFFRRGDRIELHAANPAYAPIVIGSLVETPEFRIEGVLKGLIRKL